ncbi:MAG: alpha/beta hydrolase [Verrucomicrobiaceae bacterium]|nr:MAG: alpha/beta hydrolase [Verrucomicrobiaceae bacterium]
MSVAPCRPMGMSRFIIILSALLLSLPGCKSAAPKPQATVPYDEREGRKLEMDVYLPSAPSDGLRPAVLLVHGGGWAEGHRRDFSWIGHWLAARGYVSFSTSYRLVTADANHWPAQLDDVQRSVRWIRAHAADYKVDPERIGALGASAGGHLVSCLGTMDTRDNSDPALSAHSSRVKCVVDLCGPSDLTEDLRPKLAKGEWCNGMIDTLLGNKERKGAREASPLFLVDGKSSPFLIVHGSKDDIVPLDHSQRLEAALKTAGVKAELVTMNCGHAFENAAQLQDFMQRTEKFLETHLKSLSPSP